MTPAQRELMEKKAEEYGKKMYYRYQWGWAESRESFKEGFTEGLAAQASEMEKLRGELKATQQLLEEWDDDIEKVQNERDALAERCRVLEEALGKARAKAFEEAEQILSHHVDICSDTYSGLLAAFKLVAFKLIDLSEKALRGADGPGGEND